MAPSGPPAAKAAAAPKADAKPKAKPKAKAEKAEDEGPKMDAPDRSAFDAAVAKIQEEIEGFQKEQQALQAQISGRSGGKDEYYAKRAEFRAQLDEFAAKIDALMERKGGIRKNMDDKKAEGQEMKSQLQKMTKSFGYTSEHEINERIQELEMKLQTEVMKLKDEKDIMKEMSDLRRSRPKVAQINNMKDSLATRDTGSDLRENIGSLNEEMALYRDGKRKVQEQLKALNEARQEQMGDMPQVIEQKEAIGKKIQDKIAERNTLRDEFRNKEREFNNFKNEQRRLKQEKWNEEKGAKQAEWDQQVRARKAESLDMQPFVSEITLIEQSMLFCKNLVGDKGPVKEEEKKEIAHTLKDGEEILLPDREEEFYYVATAKKKKGKSNKGSKEGGSTKPIKHNAETFKLFDSLKLNAPLSTADIPATLEKLEAQLEMYNKKVAAWEITRDAKKAKILAGEYVEEDNGPEAVNSAFVFIKPHAVTDEVKALVKKMLAEADITILAEGAIKAEKIDKEQLIDTHYGAIANKAMKQKPDTLTVQQKAKDEFKAAFGLEWSAALEQGLVYNAVDGCKKLDTDFDGLNERWSKLKKGVNLLKFGGGFYCAQLDDVYVINGFYMDMRKAFTQPGTCIYYYKTEWAVKDLAWADFRGKVLGGTDPKTADEGSLRNLVFKDWENLKLKAEPNTGDNGVHASASPFEALAERGNWLGADLAKDPFGKALLNKGVHMKTIRDWTNDPPVNFEGKKQSIFDLLEDMDGRECLDKAAAISGEN